MSDPARPEVSPTVSSPPESDQPSIPEIAESARVNAFDLDFPFVPLSAMSPALYNPREISDEALGALSESLKQWGLVQPLVWNKRTGNLVGGHQRFKILKREGVKEAKTCIVDLDETDEQLLNVTLNNPAVQGEFNMKMLSDLVKVVKSKKTAEEFRKSGLEALTKQMPLFDGVKETDSADAKPKKLSQAEAAEQKLERADVKVLQLFFSTEQYKTAVQIVAEVGELSGRDNASDSIFWLLEKFHEQMTPRTIEEATEATKEEPAPTTTAEPPAAS